MRASANVMSGCVCVGASGVLLVDDGLRVSAAAAVVEEVVVPERLHRRERLLRIRNGLLLMRLQLAGAAVLRRYGNRTPD